MRLLLAACFALVAAGCVSQSSVQGNPAASENKEVDRRRGAEVHTALAAEYYSRGNLAVALAETRLAIKEDSSYPQAHNMQALVYMELREDASAREAFNRALALQPSNPETLNNFGWFLCLRDDSKRGLELLQRATADTLYATPEKAWLSAGLCLRRLGRNAEAEEYLHRAVLIRPDLIGALYNLAIITYERGAMNDAEIYLLRYMQLTQAPALEALVLGVKIARSKRDRGAEESFMQQLSRRFPDASQYRELLDKRP
jgi:type IV pilus assembly protein PilF